MPFSGQPCKAWVVVKDTGEEERTFGQVVVNIENLMVECKVINNQQIGWHSQFFKRCEKILKIREIDAKMFFAGKVVMDYDPNFWLR